nr:RICIN domain-containing protein [Streptomyces eurocidicus]
MSDVLRLGGPSMARIAQDGLNQPSDKLHGLANREYWESTPLTEAYKKDRDAASKQWDAIYDLRDGWKKPLDGLTIPAGFSESGFHWPPGSNDGKEDFYAQTGLTKWIADRFWKQNGDFYADPTPQADEKTLKAVDDLGTPRYGKDPDAGGMSRDEWNRALAERAGFTYMHGGPGENAGADNARIFLASGGFPRTAPQPGTTEYRIAVEDMKSRFSSCAWRDPIDPDKVLGDISSAAAAEWQQETVSQAAPRNQILNANSDAAEALTTGAKALGEMLGHSWVADHLARWQSYWSPGGAGWIGDAPAVIEVHAAQGRCLDVEGGKTDNSTPVQLWTCNGSTAQKWQVYGDDRGLHLQNVNSQKCLDVSGGKADNGTRIQIWSCNSSPAQTWEFNLRATTSLKSVGTGKCLDLHTFGSGNDAWLWGCNGTGAQQFDVKPTGHTGVVPPQAQFNQAKTGIADAQAGAKKQLGTLKAQLAIAKKAATASDAAQQAAYTIADASGAPRGRGLLVGQQKAQVTKGVTAALEAMVKAGETAEAATRASGGDSQTIAERALAQAAQAKAEFRKEAAHTAELQAKAAAGAAKAHRDKAKEDKETAEAKLAEAVKAEADAKKAAADAHAKRLAAEAEEKTAKAEKETAAAKQAEAAEHKRNAEAYASTAKEADKEANKAAATAEEKRGAAEKARDSARAKRDDAWDAEQQANAARAKADAKDAYADAHESGDNAKEARAAADQADKAAGEAESAARSAEGEADAATQAASGADAAATRAEAAAKRARSDADGAQAAKLKADAAVKTATSAAADAIQASHHAASEAKSAVEQADAAEQEAKNAKSQADEASKEAGKALAASAKAAGYAYVTAQAAVDAGNAASQVAKPANDAIQLGSPYVTSDSAAGLVVLTGQASKTIAEQQRAVADAHAKNAQEEAALAKSLAEAAQGDAKDAYQHAANAASHAADARTYAKEALGYAAEAAKAASQAAASLARTVEYDGQAAEDAAAADKAAGGAEGYAKQARDAADQAALDAQAARDAAADARAAAKDARQAAERADADATAAETAAKDAQKAADDAQKAAEEAARKEANKQVSAGAGTGIEHTFYVVDKVIPVGDPEATTCVLGMGNSGCDVTFTLHFDAKVSFYLCINPDVPATEAGCPKRDTVFLDTQTYKDLTKSINKHFSNWDIVKEVDKAFLAGIWKVLTQDFVNCYHQLTPGNDGGNVSGCAWAAVAFVPGEKVVQAVKLAGKVEETIKTGVGAEMLLQDLKKIFGEKPSAKDLANPDSLAGMALRLAERMTDRTKAANSVDLDLVRKLEASGANFNRSQVVMAVRYPRPGVPVAWLEVGDVRAGLVHIIFRHAGEFMQKGVAAEDIPKLLKNALADNKVIGHQGANGGRTIYETVFNGKTHQVAITVGDNGFIVGANPV